MRWLRLAVGIAGAMAACLACSSRSSKDAANTGGTTGTSGAGGSAAAAGSGGSAAAAGSGGSAAGGGSGHCEVSTHSCQPAPPAGWTATIIKPGVVSDGCDAPIVGGSDVSALASVCPACSCGSLTSGACETTATLHFGRGSSACDGLGCQKDTSYKLDGSCAPITLICSTPSTPFDVTYPEVKVTAGTCTPSQASPPSFTQPSFVDPQTLCGVQASAEDCGAGQVCFPKPPAGAVPRYCVYKITTEPCPLDYPNEREVLYTGVTDSRSCSPCGCSTAGMTCNLNVKAFSSGCPEPGTSVNFTPGKCTSKFGTHLKLTAAPKPGDTCAPTGGALSGDVAPAKPTKICCTTP